MCLVSGSSGPSASTTLKTLAPQARLAVQDAFNKFEQTVLKTSIEDSHNFQSTSLEDVRNAAKEIERQLAARQCLRNMRRIQPFLDRLENYSKVIEVLCNGTPYLPWIWAPVKLMLQLAADFTAAFEKLISAYGQIAENLPRFDRLSDTFSDNPEFQQVLAIVYADILEFHHSAYKFFRRRGWKCFFSSSWGRFDARFKCILESLAKHTDMVDREANAFAIAEAREWRQRAIQAAAMREMEQSAAQVQSVISWLGSTATKQDQQDDLLDRLLCSCYPETSEWIVRNSKIRAWSKDQPTQPLLWLKGKPGSGKSILCSKLIQFLGQDRQSTVLFHFCSYLSADSTQSALVLKSLTAQLLRHNRDLSSYIYDEFILKGLTSSVQNLKQILANLLSSVKGPRIIIDGLDECEDAEQKVVLRDILPYASGGVSGVACKILIASRDVRYITAVLSKGPTLSLNDESNSINAAIQSFVHQRILEMYEKFQDLEVDERVIFGIEKEIVTKSEGMFLWVRLVLSVLEDDVYSTSELKTVVRSLPTGLKDFYERILDRIRNLSPQSFKKAIRILEWIAFAKRPLQKFELQNALAFPTAGDTPNEGEKLSETVLHLCRPLIEDGFNGIVTFVHFSVHEYLVHKLSGPFLKQPKAEYDLTTACVACIGFSIGLINARSPEDHRTANVGRGLHALYLYANEYWIDHLSSYIHAGGSLNTNESGSLRHQLGQLVDLQKRYEVQSLSSSAPPRDCFLSVDGRLAYLADCPEIHRLASKIVAFRDSQQRKQLETNFDTTRSQERDPTPFSNMLHSYLNRVHQLLRCDSFPGLTNGQLSIFKSTYGPTAFVCRFFGCTQSTTGFANDQLRRQHELIHAPPLLCNNSNCSYGLSFGSLEALKRHMRENHEDTPPTIPRSVRLRSVKLSTTVLENGVSTQPASSAVDPDTYTCVYRGCTLRFETSQELQKHERDKHHRNLISLSNESDNIIFSSPSQSQSQERDSIDCSPVTVIYHILKVLQGHSDVVNAVAFSPDGKLVASASDDRTIRLWDAATGAALQTLKGHSSLVCAVAFSPDGKLVASASHDHTARLWDAATGAALQTLKGHSNLVYAVAFSSVGKLVASASDDRTVRLWDAATGAALQTLKGHSNLVYAITFSPDGKLVASASDDRTVRLWDVATGAALQTLEGHSDVVNAVAFSPDGKLVASASYDHTVRLWDAATGVALQTLKGHLDGVRDVAFSPDGKQVASASYDRTVRLWDAATGAALQTLKGHSSSVYAVAFSPDGKLVASYDRTVRLWDAATGAALQTLEGHSRSVCAVAFSLDSKLVASASYDSTVRLWKAAEST